METQRQRLEIGICELCGKPVYEDEGRETIQWHDGRHIVHMWHNGTEERWLTWRKRLLDGLLELT